MIEYLERLGLEFRGERWLARDGDALVNVVVHDDEDQEWLDGVYAGTVPWLGFRNGRVVTVRALVRAPRLTVVTGDERGTRFCRAAAALPVGDPDRETWCVHEIVEIARALEAMRAHVPGFVHRRANDEHLVVGFDGRVRLSAPIAFVAVGPIPNYVGRGHVITGMRWLSPEQARGLHVSPATDVFQLATTLHAALTGKHPFARDTDYDTLRAITEGPRPAAPPSTDPRLGEVLAAAMTVDPAARTADVTAFAEALAACALPGDLDRARARIASAQQPPHPPPRASVGVAGTRCHRRWDELVETADPTARHCVDCQLDVVRVRSIEALVPLLGKRCVAFSDGN